MSRKNSTRDPYAKEHMQIANEIRKAKKELFKAHREGSPLTWALDELIKRAVQLREKAVADAEVYVAEHEKHPLQRSDQTVPGNSADQKSIETRAAAIVEDTDHIDYKTRMAIAHAMKTEDEDLPELVKAVEGGERIKDRQWGSALSYAYTAFIGDQQATKAEQVFALTDYIFGRSEPLDETELSAVLLWLELIRDEPDLIADVIVKLFWHSELRHEVPEKHIRSIKDRVLTQIQSGRKITEADELRVNRESEAADNEASN